MVIIGECTQFAEDFLGSVGLFLLVNKCGILGIASHRSCQMGSIYVTDDGEEDIGLNKGTPLHLSEAKYDQLNRMWAENKVFLFIFENEKFHIFILGLF